MDYKLWIIKIDIIINLYFFIKWTIVIPIDGTIVIPINVVQNAIIVKKQPIF